ncbi:MAG: DUF2786 domain-containing protein [Burkholderiales bacterium]
MNNIKDTDLQAVMRRVQKLLAIAADGRANPAEAAAAARMAERIMRKYQLEHADVIAEQLKSSDSLNEAQAKSSLSSNDGGTSRVPMWAQNIASRVGPFLDCKTNILFTPTGRRLNYMGFRADVTVAVWLHNYIVASMIRATKHFADQNPAARRAHTSSFRRGYVDAVCVALEQATQEKCREMQGESGSRALVVAKDRAIEERFGKWEIKDKTPAAPASATAHMLGAAEGRKLDVTRRAVEHDSDAPLLLEAR